MNLPKLAASAVLGYLCGSISSARVVKAVAAPQADISKIELPFPGGDAVFVSDAVSASSMRLNLGPRYGVATALLDMAKVTVPTLALKKWRPDRPYYLVAATTAVLGHAWPVYHRFKGGRGESAILGGLLVIDPLGAVATNAAGWVLSLASGQLLVLRWAGLVLTIPWMWFRHRDPWKVAYAVIVNASYWVATIPDLRAYAAVGKQARLPTNEELSRLFGMTGSLGRVLDRYSLPAVWKRWASDPDRLDTPCE